MQVLNERTAIAKALNFGEFPVLTMNVNNTIKSSSGEIVGFEGCVFKKILDFLMVHCYMIDVV